MPGCHHLLVNLLKPKGVVPLSTYVAKDLTLTLSPVENAAELLADLLELRWKGLREPLAFFPESALAWVQTKQYGSGFDQAWSGRYNPAPESAPVAVRIAFRGSDPIGKDFEDLAERVFLPMLEHSEVLKAEKDLT